MSKKIIVFLLILISSAIAARQKTMSFHLQFERPEVDEIIIGENDDETLNNNKIETESYPIN